MNAACLCGLASLLLWGCVFERQDLPEPECSPEGRALLHAIENHGLFETMDDLLASDALDAERAQPVGYLALRDSGTTSDYREFSPSLPTAPLSCQVSVPDWYDFNSCTTSFLSDGCLNAIMFAWGGAASRCERTCLAAAERPDFMAHACSVACRFAEREFRLQCQAEGEDLGAIRLAEVGLVRTHLHVDPHITAVPTQLDYAALTLTLQAHGCEIPRGLLDQTPPEGECFWVDSLCASDPEGPGCFPVLTDYERDDERCGTQPADNWHLGLGSELPDVTLADAGVDP